MNTKRENCTQWTCIILLDPTRAEIIYAPHCTGNNLGSCYIVFNDKIN